MKNKKLLTKECCNCGYVIVQSKRSWDGKPDKNDENMQLENCPFCGCQFKNGIVTDEYGYFSNLEKRVYEEYINNNPEKEKLYNERINGKPIRTPKEIAEREKAKTERQRRVQEHKKTANPNIPKCPTCSSANIEKISSFDKAAGAVMFGLFSKTARSQFKCKNCGYKW